MTKNPHWLSEEEEKTLGEIQSEKEYKGDPTAKFSGVWFFFDETWGSLFGPYKTRNEAHKAAKSYAEIELGL